MEIGGADFPGKRRTDIVLDIDESDLGLMRGQGADDIGANAGRPARHECDTAGKT